MGPLVDINPSAEDGVAAVDSTDFAFIFVRFGVALLALFVGIQESQGGLGAAESAQFSINPLVFLFGLNRCRVLIHHQKEASCPLAATDELTLKVQSLGRFIVKFAAQCTVGEQEIEHGKMGDGRWAMGVVASSLIQTTRLSMKSRTRALFFLGSRVDLIRMVDGKGMP